MILCYSEFRTYALVRQIKSVWRVRKHETQSNRGSCVFHFSYFELYLYLCIPSKKADHSKTKEILITPNGIFNSSSDNASNFSLFSLDGSK